MLILTSVHACSTIIFIIVVRTSFGLVNRRYILINDEAYRSLASKL